MQGFTGETGTIVFCVQDDPTVNFSGVFVNFGNVQINTATSGDNTINDNDDFGDDTGMPTTSATGTDAGNETNETDPATTTSAPETTETETSAPPVTTTANTGAGAETIQVSDVECSRVAGRGNFDFDLNGQRNFPHNDDENETDEDNETDGENPGRADERRGRSDAPCDHDQGFGNDWKCEGGRASKDIETESGDVNLLNYKDGRAAAFIARAELPPITINDVCVTIDDVRVTTQDGDDRDVVIELDRICIDGPIEIREGHETLAVFKVDLTQSLREDDDRIVFVPVIHVRTAAPVTQTIEIRETVTVTTTASASNETVATTVSTTQTFGNETATPTNTTSPTSGP